MDVGVKAAAPPPPIPSTSSASSSTSSRSSRSSGYGSDGKPSSRMPNSHSNHPSTPNKQVNFGSGNVEEKKREKFLTAKYGAHQMALIRKRLRVEMWMYERLQELYGAVSLCPIGIEPE